MDDARPNREPDETYVPERIARSNDEEDAEGGIYAQDHLQILRSSLAMPCPTGWPQDRERPKAEHADDTCNYQRDLQILDASELLHYPSRLLSLLWVEKSRPQAGAPLWAAGRRSGYAKPDRNSRLRRAEAQLSPAAL